MRSWFQQVLQAACFRGLRAGCSGASTTRGTAYLMISAYSLSFPLLSLHFLNMTDASTLAGENVLGSLSREITLSKIVLEEVTTAAESELMHSRIMDDDSHFFR